MGHISDTELRQNLDKVMDEVCAGGAPTVVTRADGRSVVMMSEAEFSSMQETLHLLSSPANAERLRRSIASADAGRRIDSGIE